MYEVAARLASTNLESGDTPRVSVVVATHNRAGLIPELLEALAAQSLGTTSFEVVVVDDASDDGTWAALEKCAAESGLRLRAARLGENAGAGAARTVGVALARGEIVAFTDDDCIPEATWLDRLVAPFATHAQVIVQGQTTAWPGDADRAGAWARTVWVLRLTWLFETCNVAYRREDVMAVGGFPGRAEAPVTRTGRPTGEDAMLGWKVVDRGAQLVYAPEARMYHRNEPGTWWDWVREQRGRDVFAALVVRSPYARRALWARVFLGPRSAATVVGVLGLLLCVATRRTWWLGGLVPWVALALPEARHRPGRHPLVRLTQIAVVDAAGLAYSVRSSVRHRRLVL
ncbi:MAG: glycosyltransferase family 2 protein [Acidimicrobiales bacterium]